MSQSGSSKAAEKSPSKKMQKDSPKMSPVEKAKAMDSTKESERNAVPGIVFREVKKEKMEKEKKAAAGPSTATKKRMKMLAAKKAKVKIQLKRKEKTANKAESAAQKDESLPEVDESQVIEDVMPLNTARQEQCVDLEMEPEEKSETEQEKRKKEEEEREKKKEFERKRKEEEEEKEKKEELEKKKKEEEEWKKMMKEIREEAEKKNEDEASEPASMETEEVAVAEKAAEEKVSAKDAEVEMAEDGPEQTEELKTDEDFTGYYSSEEGEKEKKEEGKEKSAEKADIIEEIDGWSTEEDREKKKPQKGKVVNLEKKRKRAVEGKLPKKKKTKAESSSGMARAEAEARKKEAQESLKGKQFLQEQGFETELTDIPQHILRKINERGWQKLCVPQAHEARGAWVREFYAGIEDEESYSSDVQRKIISWAPEDWNALFELEQRSECQYEQLLRAPSKALLTKCLKTIGNKDAEWSGGVQKKTFPSCMLNEEAHVWATFVKSCLMPTSHDSSLTTERCLLIYAIMEGLYIDVGKLISQEIKRWLLKSSGKIFFPHSITALCSRQGLKTKPSDDILKPRKPLNANAKVRIRSSRRKSAGVGVAAGIAEMMDELRKFYAYVVERDMALKNFFAEFKQPGPLIPEFPDILHNEESSEEE